MKKVLGCYNNGSMFIEVNSESEMKVFGSKLGSLLSGGEVIELIGDVGSGKTTLVKGIARGLNVDDDVQSPSFTISRVYSARDDLTLAHYDFYRLSDPGIMKNELQENLNDDKTITVIEWGGVIGGILPSRRLTIEFNTPSESMRQLNISGDKDIMEKL